MTFREYIQSFDPAHCVKRFDEDDDSFENDEEIKDLKRKEAWGTLRRFGNLAADTIWTTPAANALDYARTGGQQGLKPLNHNFPGEEMAVGSNIRKQHGGFDPYAYDERRRARQKLGAGTYDHDRYLDYEIMSMPYDTPTLGRDRSGDTVLHVAHSVLDDDNYSRNLQLLKKRIPNEPSLQAYKNNMVLSGIKRNKPVAIKGPDGKTYMKVVWTIPLVTK